MRVGARVRGWGWLIRDQMDDIACSSFFCTMISSCSPLRYSCCMFVPLAFPHHVRLLLRCYITFTDYVITYMDSVSSLWTLPILLRIFGMYIPKLVYFFFRQVHMPRILDPERRLVPSSDPAEAEKILSRMRANISSFCRSIWMTWIQAIIYHREVSGFLDIIR
jgi:hypothetical protein